MNEDKMIWMLSQLDDDRAEKEIDRLMEGVEFDRESIKRKAVQKIARHNKKSHPRRRLAYAAAICACFVCINVVYADEISETLKTFFNKTPIYSTMVDGKAYYLPQELKLDDKTTINSFLVSADRMEMELTSDLSPEILYNMKTIPKNDPNTEYGVGVFSKNGDKKYFLDFANVKEKKFKFKPGKEFNLLVGGQTYVITLEEARSLDGTQKLAESEPSSNKIDAVTVGANSIEQNGKRAVQMIASFKDQDMKLNAFGESLDKISRFKMENLGKDGILSSGTGPNLADIYVTDEKGNKYKLEKPQGAKAMPVTTFVSEAPEDTSLTVIVPALQACYEKKVADFSIDIPKNGEESLNREIDLLAQKAVVKSVTRLSPTSAKLVMQLNTGDQKFVKIRTFMIYSQDIKKIEVEFSGDIAMMTLEFNKDVNAADFEISWPMLEMNGNWTINLK